MIVSASRRTDIPAFFGDWFIHRIKEGYFYKVNPVNPKQVKAVSLKPQDVDAVVFWTKNPKPFMKHLRFLDELGYKYYFQFTLNDYPKVFEPHVPSVKQRINTFQELSRFLGKQRVVWRYDPIMVSSITPERYHLEKINYLAENLKGHTERLVISFMDYYGKVERRLKHLEKSYNIRFEDIVQGEVSHLMGFAAAISRIGREHGLEVFTCAENIDFAEVGIKRGSCIDAGLINSLFHCQKLIKKDPNQRPECLCAESVDVGIYNTCRFQCAYCYANYSEKAIVSNLACHDVHSPVLVDKYLANAHIEKTYIQLSLLD